LLTGMCVCVCVCVCVCEQESVDLERLRNLLNQADEKLAAANQSLEVTRRQKNEQVRDSCGYIAHITHVHDEIAW
jgi:hypothetical protein